MSDASKDSHYTHGATIVLKPFPGQAGVTQPHLRRTWMEGTMAIFASVGLLGVANGKPSPVAELITDHDLTHGRWPRSVCNVAVSLSTMVTELRRRGIIGDTFLTFTG